MSDLETASLMAFIAGSLMSVGQSRPYSMRDFAPHTPSKAERAQMKARKQKAKQAKASRKKNRK